MRLGLGVEDLGRFRLDDALRVDRVDRQLGADIGGGEQKFAGAVGVDVRHLVDQRGCRQVPEPAGGPVDGKGRDRIRLAAQLRVEEMLIRAGRHRQAGRRRLVGAGNRGFLDQLERARRPVHRQDEHFLAAGVRYIDDRLRWCLGPSPCVLRSGFAAEPEPGDPAETKCQHAPPRHPSVAHRSLPPLADIPRILGAIGHELFVSARCAATKFDRNRLRSQPMRRHLGATIRSSPSKFQDTELHRARMRGDFSPSCAPSNRRMRGAGRRNGCTKSNSTAIAYR